MFKGLELERIELAKTIAIAIEATLMLGRARNRSVIARYFNMKPSSLHDWEDTGRVSEEKLPRVIGYFKPVTTPKDWGLETWPSWIVLPTEEELNAADQTDKQKRSPSFSSDSPKKSCLEELLRLVVSLDESKRNTLLAVAKGLQ